MANIQIDLPDSILLATGQSAEEFVRDAKFLLALELFEVGRISSGRAAELSGVPRVELLSPVQALGSSSLTGAG